jgi:hypothetical protein
MFLVTHSSCCATATTLSPCTQPPSCQLMCSCARCSCLTHCSHLYVVSVLLPCAAARCLDQYFELRVRQVEQKEAVEVDARLVAVVERMLDRYVTSGLIRKHIKCLVLFYGLGSSWTLLCGKACCVDGLAIRIGAAIIYCAVRLSWHPLLTSHVALHRRPCCSCLLPVL